MKCERLLSIIGILIEIIILAMLIILTNRIKLSTYADDVIDSHPVYAEYYCCDTINESINQLEIDYLAKCVMAEAGTQDDYGKRLVIDVILNRVDSDYFPNSIIEVINQSGQFEVVQNGSINEMVPTDNIYTLINQEIENESNEEVLYFRTSHYHSFGTPVLVHQDHYFSK